MAITNIRVTQKLQKPQPTLSHTSVSYGRLTCMMIHFIIIWWSANRYIFNLSKYVLFRLQVVAIYRATPIKYSTRKSTMRIYTVMSLLLSPNSEKCKKEPKICGQSWLVPSSRRYANIRVGRANTCTDRMRWKKKKACSEREHSTNH